MRARIVIICLVSLFCVRAQNSCCGQQPTGANPAKTSVQVLLSVSAAQLDEPGNVTFTAQVTGLGSDEKVIKWELYKSSPEEKISDMSAQGAHTLKVESTTIFHAKLTFGTADKPKPAKSPDIEVRIGSGSPSELKIVPPPQMGDQEIDKPVKLEFKVNNPKSSVDWINTISTTDKSKVNIQSSSQGDKREAYILIVTSKSAQTVTIKIGASMSVGGSRFSDEISLSINFINATGVRLRVTVSPESDVTTSTNVSFSIVVMSGEKAINKLGDIGKTNSKWDYSLKLNGNDVSTLLKEKKADQVSSKVDFIPSSGGIYEFNVKCTLDPPDRDPLSTNAHITVIAPQETVKEWNLTKFGIANSGLEPNHVSIINRGGKEYLVVVTDTKICISDISDANKVFTISEINISGYKDGESLLYLLGKDSNYHLISLYNGSFFVRKIENIASNVLTFSSTSVEIKKDTESDYITALDSGKSVIGINSRRGIVSKIDVAQSSSGSIGTVPADMKFSGTREVTTSMTLGASSNLYILVLQSASRLPLLPDAITNGVQVAGRQIYEAYDNTLRKVDLPTTITEGNGGQLQFRTISSVSKYKGRAIIDSIYSTNNEANSDLNIVMSVGPKPDSSGLNFEDKSILVSKKFAIHNVMSNGDGTILARYFQETDGAPYKLSLLTQEADRDEVVESSIISSSVGLSTERISGLYMELKFVLQTRIGDKTIVFLVSYAGIGGKPLTILYRVK